PPNSIVIAYADYFAGSLFYLQEAEQQRPDVVVLAYGLSGSSWHWRHIQELHRELETIDLRASHSRAARVRAWLDANAGRAVLVEQLSIARALGLPACAGGLYLRADARCERPEPPSPIAQRLLSRERDALGAGAPGALGAIAQVSEVLGEAFWRLGF